MAYSKTKISLFFSEVFSATLVMMGAPEVSFAQSAAQSSSLSDLFACEAVSGAEAQLSCFRAETAKLRGAAPSAPAASAPVQTESLAVQRETLALEKQRLAEEKARLAAEKKRIAALEKQVEKKANPPREQTVAIASTTKFGANRFIRFTLENGEVWQQTEAGYVRLGRGDPDMMMLKRTSFGAMTGRVNGKAPTLRLKRVN